ncbi:MAG TPA: hypothetical protein HA272_04350 [Methanoregula sp.]|nr:hypothetical protein [Methanoregula sp.]
MHSRGIILLCIMLAASFLFCAGCIAPQEPGSSVVPGGQPATETTTAASPSPSPPASPVPGESPLSQVPSYYPTVSPQPVATTPTWIPKSYGRDAAGDPQIVLLTFVKEYFIFDIPNCAMREVFPEAAGDPAYGIRQPVPKLVMVPDHEISAFIRANAGEYASDPNPYLHVDPNTIGGTACSGGALGNPKWNFVRINATLMPRNARPGEYDIGINIRSRGIIIEQLRLNRSFAIDRPVIIAGYVPLRLDETDAFDTIDLTFAKRT